jgi:hypothetical protein
VQVPLREQCRRTRQRTLEDHVLELGWRPAQTVDAVVASDAVEID